MKYELLCLKEMDYGECGKKENANVALILRGDKRKEYAVVRNLDISLPEENNCQWDNTIIYADANAKGLLECLEVYRIKTEENYIPRCRLEELATVFKDMMIENCYVEEIDETLKERDLNEYELEFFNLKDYILDTE